MFKGSIEHEGLHRDQRAHSWLQGPAVSLMKWKKKRENGVTSAKVWSNAEEDLELDKGFSCYNMVLFFSAV